MICSEEEARESPRTTQKLFGKKLAFNGDVSSRIDLYWLSVCVCVKRCNRQMPESPTHLGNHNI